jgi:CheY-like chemotaxis protein
MKFTILDNGIGIAECNQDKIFDSFTQVDSSATRQYDGMGLGLSVCKQLIQLMNGEIHVRSKLGHGSEFWFEIPVSITKQKVERPTTVSAEEFKTYMAGATILVVEDNAINQKVCTNILRRLGCNSIEIANNGLEAVRTVQNISLPPIDIILMDVMMPIMDGFDATKAIRELEKTNKLLRFRKPRVPIICVTACDVRRTKEKVLRNGADLFITKPIVTTELIALLKTLCKTVLKKQ